MRSSCLRFFVNFLYVATGLFRLRQISKVKQYDVIEKSILGAGDCSPGKIHKVFRMLTRFSRGQKNCTKRDDDDNKRASMTMNEDELGGEKFSRTSLWHVSQIFRNMSSTCQNICRVRAEYVRSPRSVRAK